MTDLRTQLQSTLGDGYTLERELGGGGMSRVFVAHENALGRTVVVKVIAPELAEGVSAERFACEVKLAARLQQANIVPVISTGSSGSLPYYTMPFVTGESLRARLASGTRLTVSQAVSILRDVARALSYAHAQGVVHRDIKPENILLSGGTAVVTDFGIAKALSASRTLDDAAAQAASTSLTQAGGSIGTPAYMAPEQAVGADVDHRADIYAWGVVAYELLAGAHPFTAKANSTQMIAAHLTETPAPLTSRNADVSPALNDLVQRCLAKDATHRPASADEVLQALDAIATPSAVTGSAARSGATVPSGRRRNVMLLAGGVIAIAAVVALVSKGWRVGVALTPSASPTTASNAAAAAVNRSIAVLPLANLSGDKADDFFGIGLAEEMTRALSKTGVRVIGRSSAGALQARGMDESAIARELGVGSLLTGSVQRAAGQVRVNVSLVSATDGAVTWTEKYDRPLTNVFALQDEIARAVATKLLGALGGARAAQATRVETVDPEAYAWYLQGQVLFGRRTAQTVRQSIALFERAVARDPSFARAQGALALAISAIPFYEQGTARTTAPLAIAAARRAIALDSTVAEAWGAIGSAKSSLWENLEADANYRRAQMLDSSVATLWGWHALNLIHMGRFEEARDRTARAQAAEPASLIARTWAAQLLMTERRYREADSATRAILAMDSTYALALDARGEVLSYLGKHDDAVAVLTRNLAQLPTDRPNQTEGILAYVLARAGKPAESRAAMNHLRRVNGGELPAMAVLAATFEVLGDHAGAVDMIARAVKQSDNWLQMYNRAERYDALRKDPRADAIMASIEK
ncbi:FlgO family outer membrane protein [Gemmatimonas sp.]|uniref:protein kinase domain-containing protein n=1 Tax=Gemmatimonas sp. TaxID=1962908 RepID=UPI00286E08C7|nr:FlgO family outer membrane protein [Gemmatimonas sp.]